MQGQSAGPSDYLQADFTFLLGASFSDPNDAAALEVGRVVIENNLNHLAAFELDSSAQPETLLRGIEYQAGEPYRLEARIDD